MFENVRQSTEIIPIEPPVVLAPGWYVASVSETDKEKVATIKRVDCPFS